MVKQFNERRNNAVRRNQRKTESYEDSEKKYTYTVEMTVTLYNIEADSFEEARDIAKREFWALRCINSSYIDSIENDDTGEVEK